MHYHVQTFEYGLIFNVEEVEELKTFKFIEFIYQGSYKMQLMQLTKRVDL